VTAPVFLLRPLPEAGHLLLDGTEGRHAATVRRLRVGERIDVTDGWGELAECVVVAAARDRLELDVIARTTVPAPTPRLTVVQALVKGERSELAVELVTEVGVDEVVPWEAERCVSRWIPGRSDRRWEQAVAEASKQARRARWPAVAAVTSTAALAERIRHVTAAGGLAYVLHEAATTALAGQARPAETSELLLVVGPEGGISDAELDVLTGTGACPVRLGPTVLRASTAGCAAAAVLLAETGRWKGDA
jgi:16S rRNA (uracil1498-N3)-methyltransferase